MNKKIKTEAVDSLFDNGRRGRSITAALSQRFEVASMLRDHKTYLDIAEKTGASTATISRVNRSLNYGNDGYELAFNRLPQK